MKVWNKLHKSVHDKVFKLTPGQQEIANLHDVGLSVELICEQLGKTRHAVQSALVEIAGKRQAVGNK